MNIAKTFGAAKGIIMRAGLKIKAASPEILLGTGLVCGAAAIVTTVIASRKVDKVIEEAKDELEVVNDRMTRAEDEEEEANARHQTVKVYASLAWKLCKLYGPTALLVVASGASILASHGILKQRYLSTAAAYKALDEAYKSYRDYVENDLGYGDSEKAIAAQATCRDDVKEELEDGTAVNVEGNKLVASAAKRKSPYEFDFNRYTAKWTWKTNPEENRLFLQAAQNYMNDLFHSRGYLFLNEVLEYLGIEQTSAGQVIGWIRGEGDPDVDFRFMECYMRDWATDSDLCKKNIHLDFNCSGIMYDKLPKLV